MCWPVLLTLYRQAICIVHISAGEKTRIRDLFCFVSLLRHIPRACFSFAHICPCPAFSSFTNESFSSKKTPPDGCVLKSQHKVCITVIQKVLCHLRPYFARWISRESLRLYRHAYEYVGSFTTDICTIRAEGHLSTYPLFRLQLNRQSPSWHISHPRHSEIVR